MWATAARSRVSRGSESAGRPRTWVIALRSPLAVRQAVGQHLGVGRAEQVGRRRRPRSASSVRVVRSPGHRAGVLQLQQLHRPLDVGQPAAAELEVGGRVGAARQPLVVDAGLDPADLADVVLG